MCIYNRLIYHHDSVIVMRSSVYQCLDYPRLEHFSSLCCALMLRVFFNYGLSNSCPLEGPVSLHLPMRFSQKGKDTRPGPLRARPVVIFSYLAHQMSPFWCSHALFQRKRSTPAPKTTKKFNCCRRPYRSNRHLSIPRPHSVARSKMILIDAQTTPKEDEC